MVRRGTLLTPPLTADILESITRTTLLGDVIPDLRLEVQEREIARTELYVADEAFLCGSGYEITPILSIDRFPLGTGEVGPITKKLSRAYMDLVRGIDKRHSSGARRSTSRWESPPAAEIEERPGFPGALRASGGHVGALSRPA